MEEPDFAVLLTEAGSSQSEAVKAVKAVTGLSLWRSKLLMERAPVSVLQGTCFEAAGEAARRLRQAGVRTAVRCGWCDHVLPPDGTPLDPAGCQSPYWPTAHCPANVLSACDCDWCTTYGRLPGLTTPAS